MGKTLNHTDWGMDILCQNRIIQIDTNHMYPKYSRIKNFSMPFLSIVLIKVLCPFATTNVCSGKDVFYFNSYLLMPILQVMFLHVWIC